MAKLGKTIQQMADEEAAAAGLDPLAARTDEFYEYAPKAPDGTIWWVYKQDDPSMFEVDRGWTLVHRKIKVEKSAWEDMPDETS